MSFWANLFSSSKDRFSLDEMQRLHTVLLRNQVVTDSNRETVVETLRSIAELTIWGDQHDPSMVEYFLTENMLGHFHQILLQRSARRGTVAIQVLQTLSILIQNIRNQQTIYYLFSNDHINNIAALKFDFEDDEVLGYYVNLLKTISFRLNETTVQFFFRSGSGSGSGGGGGDGSTTPASSPGTPSSTMLAASFPLYTEAVKFVAHRDGMVRAAVKTLTLNVFAIDLPSLRNFLSSPPADILFDHLANYTVERCTALDRLLSSWDATAPRMAATVETYLAEIEDILTFCNDVFAVGVSSISSLLLGHLWRQVVGPVLFWPLLGEDTTPTNITSSNGGGDGEASQKRLVGPLCSLYALERAIYAVTDPLLSSLLVSALLGGPAEADADALAASLQTTAATAGAAATATAATTMTASDLLKGLHADSKMYRASVLSMLRGGDAQLAAAGIRLLAAVLNRKSISEETIEAVGLLPRRRRKQRKLIEELTRDASSCDITTLLERSQINGMSSTTAVATAAEKEKDGEEEEDPFPQRSTSPSRISGLRRYSPTDESVLQTLPESTMHQMNNTSNNNTTAKTNIATIASTVRGEEHFNEIIESLLTALNLDLLPPLSIPVIGWALHRLLSSDAGPAELSSQQKNSLETAWKRKRDALDAVRAGSWGDTVVPMIVQIWSKVREIVLRIGPGPVHVAGHTWVQAVLLHELHWQLGGVVGGGGGGSAFSKSTDSLIHTAANTVAEEVAASNFAIAAKVATIRVAACVAVAQIHAVLTIGQVPLQCFSTSTAATILADVSAREIREGSVVPLPENEAECMQCKVAFSRGVERIVVLCVLGFDLNQNNDESTFSSPVVAILDPGTGSTSGYGTVLSIAPLLAAAPAVDPDHPQWLHVHVRPQRSALLRLLSTGPSGAELAAMDQHLAEGHWVLAFADENSAKNAAEKVLQRASLLRQVHEKALEPLLEL